MRNLCQKRKALNKKGPKNNPNYTLAGGRKGLLFWTHLYYNKIYKKSKVYKKFIGGEYEN